MPKGELHPRARLTEADVLAIRERRAAGEKIAQLAAAFGIANNTVYSIAVGRTWTHVGGARTRDPRKPDGEDVYQRWAKGESMDAISKSLGYHQRGVSRLIREAGGHSRRDAEIVRRWQSGDSMAKVGKTFGLATPTVSRIINGAYRTQPAAARGART